MKSKDVTLHPSHTEKHTSIGWKTSKIGVCLDSFGGAIEYQLGMILKEMLQHKSREEAVAALGTSEIHQMKMLWIHGSVHGYGRIAFSLVIRRKRIIFIQPIP